jgi:ankyrin repeat protein
VSDDERLLALVRAIVDRDGARIKQLLDATPSLASAALRNGATRDNAPTFFYDEISHYCYAGDTALHMAAAAHDASTARTLVRKGADVGAINRRKAQPLHYAVDGGPNGAARHPDGQRLIVTTLLELGAEVDARDAGGTTPLLRAIRNRQTDAVEALLEAGADPRATNSRGTTAMRIATLTTGKSGSGSPAAKAAQQAIIELLGAHGA